LILAANAIVTGMVAVSFGSYASAAFADGSTTWIKMFAVLLVLAMTLLNIVGSQAVARTQTVIVYVVLTILTLFAVTTLANLDLHLLAFSGYPPLRDIVFSVALTFFAFLGFGVVTFTAKDLADPSRLLSASSARSRPRTGSGAPLVAGGAVGRGDPAQVLLDLVDRLPGGGQGAAKVEQKLLQLAQFPPARLGQRTARRRRLGHLVCPHPVPRQRAGSVRGRDLARTPADSCTSPTAPDRRATVGSSCRGVTRRQVRPADAVLTRFG
jgi:hypothetical protein